MPDLIDLQKVRLQADEADGAQGITDDYINALLATFTVNGATAIVWRVKAGKLARKVNTSTAQTRLELRSQFDHATQMYELYAELAGGTDVIGDPGVGDWESVRMAGAEDELYGGDFYWPGYGRQAP